MEQVQKPGGSVGLAQLVQSQVSKTQLDPGSRLGLCWVFLLLLLAPSPQTPRQ